VVYPFDSYNSILCKISHKQYLFFTIFSTWSFIAGDPVYHRTSILDNNQHPSKECNYIKKISYIHLVFCGHSLKRDKINGRKKEV